MKAICVYLAAIVSMCMMVACGGGGSDEPQSPLNPGGDNGGGSSPKVYTQSITVPAQGGEQSMTLIDLKSAVSSISSTPAWIVISPKQYTSGAPAIKLEVEENKATTERRAEVTILAVSGDKVVLTVTQQVGGSGSGSTAAGTGIDDPHNEQTDQPAYAPRR